MKNIIYVGQFTDASGYGNAARKYLNMLDKYLDKNSYNLRVYNSSYEKGIFCSDKDLQIIKKYELKNDEIESYVTKNSYTAIFHLLPWDAFLKKEDIYKNAIIHRNAKQKINISYWEADRLPKYWRNIFNDNLYDKVIVACEWNKEIYSKDIKTPIDIIPIPFIKRQEIVKKQNDIFTIFSLSQWQQRKGFDILIKAFYQEFYDHDDVKLVIKTYRYEASGQDPAIEKKAILQNAIEYKNSVDLYLEQKIKCKTEIITGIIGYDKLISIYENADVFCLPTRGEGFSIPTAEAALFGLPTIIPNIGGHLDFLEKSSNFYIDSFYQPVADMRNGNLFSSAEMNFVEPKILSLREQLRKAYNLWKKDKNILIEMGDKNKKYAEKYLNEEEIFNSFIKIFN